MAQLFGTMYNTLFMSVIFHVSMGHDVAIRLTFIYKEWAYSASAQLMINLVGF